MIRLVITSYGLKTAERKIFGTIVAAQHMRRPMLKIGAVLAEGTERMFDSQGRRGGGSWRGLSPEWASRKREMGLDPRILHAHGFLRESVTRIGSPNMAISMDAKGYTLRFGSKLPYGATHQKTRPYLRFVQGDLTKAANIVLDHLLEGWRK